MARVPQGAFCLATKGKADGPPGDADHVAAALAGNVEVEPCRIKRREHPHVPRQDDAEREQRAPAYSIQHAMDLHIRTNQLRFRK
jgi:hypothetical protein